jgi:hypothetical protein
MSALAFSGIMFIFIFGGALLGMWLRSTLPDHHLAPDSRDAVKVGMGFVGTMVALVLGLLVASAKSSYDTQSNEITELSADIVLLDRVLAHYGLETADTRAVLKGTASAFLARMWTSDSAGSDGVPVPAAAGEVLFDKLNALTPKDERQRGLHARAADLMMSVARVRWLMFEQRVSSVSMPLVILLVVWLTIIFTSFGLFAPKNVVVVASFFVSALSVASAVFLIMEMYSPFSGLIQISSAPLKAAIEHLGK